VTAPTDVPAGPPTEESHPSTAEQDDPARPTEADPGAGAPPKRHAPAHRRPHQRWWRVGFPVLLVVLVVAIPVLVWIGGRVVLDSNEGRIVRSISDPAAAGWEATVDPTPVMALAVVDEQDQLDSVALLALTGEGSGSVVMLPANAVMAVPGVAYFPLSSLYTGGIDSLRDVLEETLGIGVADVSVIEPSEWTGLVAPVGPLKVVNPDPVTVRDLAGQEQVQFAPGTIDLPARDVWSFLSARNPGESEINRLVRVEAFWRAWVAQVAERADEPGVVPGETVTGLGRFVLGLAAGALDATSLPVRPLPADPGSDVFYDPQTSEVQALMARVVPFPAGPEGARARMTVLDGTGSLNHGLGAAPIFTANGGQIDKVGNAPTFGVETTQFVYYDESARTRVERMRDAIGVGEIVKSDELNVAVDIVVVLGEDYLLTQPDGSVPTPDLAPTGAGG
jgi:hypothetical protein